MSEHELHNELSLKYKVISLLFAGPRYYEKMAGFAGKISDGEFVNAVNGVVEIYKKSDPDRLRTQYTSCFVNNFPTLPCPPYESWYLTRTVHGQVVVKLIRWYKKYGLYPEPLPEDHISAITEFAAYLYSVDKASGDAFVKEHVLTWIGKFADDIIDKCKDKYAAELGNLLRSFLESEKKRLVQ